MADPNLDAAFERAFGDPTVRARANLWSVADTNPDEEARNQQAARTLRIPPQSARADPAETRRQMLMRRYDWGRIQFQAPATVRFLNNPQVAAIAQDDVDGLAALEGIVARLGRMAPGFDRILQNARRDPAARQLALGRAREAGYLTAFRADPEQARSSDPRLSATLQRAQDEPYRQWAEQNPWSAYVGSAVTNIPRRLGASLLGLLDQINPWTTSDEDLAVLYRNDPEGLARARNSSVAILSRTARELRAEADSSHAALPANARRWDDLRYATLDPNQAAYLSPTRLLHDFLESAPQTVALLLTTYLTRGTGARAEAQALARGATAAEARQAAVQAQIRTFATVGALGEGTLAGVQQGQQVQQQIEQMDPLTLAQSPEYQQLLARGFTPEAARLYVATRAATETRITAGLSTFGFNVLEGPIFGRIIGQGGSLIPRVGRAAATEAVTETLQSGAEQLAANVAIRRHADPNQDIWENVLENALAGTFVGGFSGGAFGGVFGQAVHQTMAADQAQASHSFMSDLMRLAEASKVRERSPDTFAEFVEQVAEGSSVEDVFVDPRELGEVLNQSEIDPDRLEQISAALGPRVEEALRQGNDIKLSAAELTTLFAGTPAAQSLLDHIKVDPNGMSRLEAESFMQTRGEELQRQVDEVLRAEERGESWRSEIEEVRSDILDQLTRTNRFVAKVNERYADLHAAFYGTQAARLGTTPRALYDRFPVRIRSSLLGHANLEQGPKPVATIPSDILGVDVTRENAVERARDHYKKALQGKTAFREGVGEVRFTGKGWTKVKAGLRADPVRARLLASAKEVIEQGDYSGRFPVAGRRDNVVAFHHFEAPVALGEQIYSVGVSVAEDQFGNLFYNLNRDPQDLLAKRKAPGFTSEVAEGPGADTGTEASTENIADSDADLNMMVRALERRALYQSDEAPIFFSALERAIETSSTNKASPQQWLATLNKTPGVRQEELEWTELPEWLATQDGPVTKEELLAFVRAGGVQVEEVVLGADQIDERAVDALAMELRDAHIDDLVRSYEPEVYVDYPTISEIEYDEDDVPVRWEVAGEEFDSEADAQARADAIADELEQEARDEAEAEYREAVEDQTGFSAFEDEARLQLQENNPDQPRFEQYTEQGGEDYTELLLTLPEGVRGNPETSFRESGHFGEHPVVAHIRFKTREDAEGRRVLFIEEVQSDWHQKGREKGYTPRNPDPMEQRGFYEVPDAPFKGSWPALAMKRALRWAADNDFEAVAWTTGEQQRERYNLAEAVGPIKVQAVEGRYEVRMRGAVASAIAQRGLGAEGRAYGMGESGVFMSLDQIGEVFGKDLGTRMVKLADDAAEAKVVADKAAEEYPQKLRSLREALNRAARVEGQQAEVQRLSSEIKALQDSEDAILTAQKGIVTLDGDDLKIGGEGMLTFYDRMLPQITNKVLKPLGGKVEKLAIEDFEKENWSAQYAGLLEDIRRKAGLSAYGIESREEAEQRIAEYRGLNSSEATEWIAQLESVLPWFDRLDTMREQRRLAGPTNPGFVVTDEMKQKAREGFALFQKNRGAYSPATDTITLLESADLSTFLHESGHFFLEMMHRMADDAGAPQQIVQDFDTLLGWFGVKDRATWSSLTLEQKRESHEKFARGFEAYLYTGKAPSSRLRDLFRSFRAWLKAVYQSARRIGANPTPAVRGVMDRMLATDEEIQLAESLRSMEPLFKDQATSGMSEDQWRDYQRLGADATQEATEELERRSLKDMRWLANAKGREVARLKREADGIRKRVRAEVAANVAEEPVYRAQTFLKKGLLDGEKVDGPHRLYIPEVEALYADDATRDFIKAKLGYGQYGMLGDEAGMHPEQVADMFGFDSADALIRSVIEAEPMAERIEGLTEQRLLEEHGDLTDERSIDEAADRAIHNEVRARAVAAELAALSKATGKPRMLASAARQFAETTIERLRIRDVKPAKYEAAAARAAKAATTALGKGELNTAAAEKRNQLFNLYATRAARKAEGEVESALTFFTRLQKPGAAKSIDPEYIEQIESLLEKVDLRRSTTLKDISRRQSLEEWIEAQREQGFEPVVDSELVGQIGKRSYKELTVEELRGLRDAVQNIEHLGRLKNRLLTAKKDRAFGAARDAIADAIETNAVSTRKVQLEAGGAIDKATKAVRAFFSFHRKFASLARQFDGFKDGGANWQYLIRPMNEAGDREANMRTEATRRLAEILKPALEKGAQRKRLVPGTNKSLSLEGRIAVALNMGNATNRERLSADFTPDELDAVASSLTAQQWAVVQQVWDFIGSYWPQIEAKERRVTGVAPERVEAEPVQVVAAGGETLTLPGGYYPIKYNAERSQAAEQHNAAEVARQALAGAYTRSTTRRGHTKARVESTGRPLRYDLGVVVQHLNEVIHDLSWHEYLIDANRLLRDRQVDAALRDHYGPETIATLKATITDIAAGDLPAEHIWEKWIGHLRAGVTIAGMGWSTTTAALQITGFAQTLTRLGPQWVGKGLLRMGGDATRLESSVAWVREQSPFMRERASTMQREINEVMNKLRGKNGAMDSVRASFFVFIAKVQLMVDVPTWIGTYEREIARGREHDEAVAMADQMVLDTQGGGQIKDLSQAQRGGAFQKVFTNFYSYMNMVENRMAEEIGQLRLEGVKRTPMFALNMMLLSVVPTTLGYLIKAALRGDEKEPEELAKDLAKENIASLFGLFIGLRDIGSVIQSDGRTQAPAGLAYDRLAKLYQQSAQGEADPALARAINNVAGVIFHYPSAQVQRSVEGFEALRSGETSNPLALAFGPPRSDRRQRR